MPSDTIYVAHDALSRLKLDGSSEMAPNLQRFKVPYVIRGELTIRANDADAAERATWCYTKEQLAERGELEMGDPIAEQPEVIEGTVYFSARLLGMGERFV